MAYGPAVQNVVDKINQAVNLPAGTEFNLTLTDRDLSDAANEYLAENMDAINVQLESYIGTTVKLSDVVIVFTPGKVNFSIKVGKGILKLNASAELSLTWLGDALSVETKSVEVPIIKLDTETVNSFIQGPVHRINEWLKQYYDVHSIQVVDGAIIIHATKM